MRILMAAAENDGLSGGKVGGIGDVIREIPPALAKLGCEVTIVTPSHGFLHRLPGATRIGSVVFSFSGNPGHRADLYQVPGKTGAAGVRHMVVDHPLLAHYSQERGKYLIYADDPPERPFATDATRYALFCAATAAATAGESFGPMDCIHLHDWHTAFLLILRKFHPGLESLQGIRAVYTIHNLGIQGIRPFRGDESSLEAWFPDLPYSRTDLVDPRWTDCMNPMAAGIRLADMVHTVSPSYAEEILLPSDKPRYFGGEGLDPDLLTAKEQGRLKGILNGCEYPGEPSGRKKDFPGLLNGLKQEVVGWAGERDFLPASIFLAYTRITEMENRPGLKPQTLLTGVTRAVDQKLYLMRASGSEGESGIGKLLEALRGRAALILLGTGDPAYERFLSQMSARFSHFIFLCGYSDACARDLYAGGDLFLMPSSYEPCGISQMLAMRQGQPCVVHGVGGAQGYGRRRPRRLHLPGGDGGSTGGRLCPDRAPRRPPEGKRSAAICGDPPKRCRGPVLLGGYGEEVCGGALSDLVLHPAFGDIHILGNLVVRDGLVDHAATVQKGGFRGPVPAFGTIPGFPVPLGGVIQALVVKRAKHVSLSGPSYGISLPFHGVSPPELVECLPNSMMYSDRRREFPPAAPGLRPDVPAGMPEPWRESACVRPVFN